jgi:hypothetical protein
MSHFNALVLLPGSTPTDRVHGRVARLMAPYDEDLDMPEYTTPCPCAGEKAREEVTSLVNAEYDIAALRQQFWALPEGERTEARWRELAAPRTDRWNALLAEHPQRDMPNPRCGICGGIGGRLTSANPLAKWDYWNIGGRWDGWIFGPEREQQCQDGEGGFNFGDAHHSPENNCRSTRDIPIDDPHYLPFAVVTPDGKWHEQGAMGWWAIVARPMDEHVWHDTVKALLAAHPGHLAVAVDCHV